MADRSEPQHQDLEDLYGVIDDLWSNIGANEVRQLRPETRAICQIIHEERYHDG